MNIATRTRLSRVLRRTASDEDGQALVEFALVLPLLMLAIAMVLEFGKVFHYWQDESHLASQGARLASVNSNPGGGSLQSYLQGQADAPELRDGGTDAIADPVKVCITPGAKIGDPVKVEVSTTYKWLPILGGVATSTIRDSATMRMERLPTKYSGGCS
jgi:Flp pilus assembly pilin Flp